MYFDRKKYKEFAIIQLKDRLRVPMLMVIVYMAVQRIISIPTDLMPNFFNDLSNYLRSLTADDQLNLNFIYNSLPDYYNSFIVSGICWFISLLFSFVITIATDTIYIQMSKSPENVTFKSFFKNFKKWWKGLATGLWRLLWLTIWMIPAFILSAFVGVLVYFASDYMQFFILSTGMTAVIVACIPAIAKDISYSFTFFLSAEFDKVTPVQALKLSKIITRNHLMDIFLLRLSFIGWIFLVAFTWGVAGLWVYPYMKLTLINAYHALLKKAVESSLVSMEELGISENIQAPQEIEESEETN